MFLNSKTFIFLFLIGLLARSTAATAANTTACTSLGDKMSSCFAKNANNCNSHECNQRMAAANKVMANVGQNTALFCNATKETVCVFTDCCAACTMEISDFYSCLTQEKKTVVSDYSCDFKNNTCPKSNDAGGSAAQNPINCTSLENTLSSCETTNKCYGPCKNVGYNSTAARTNPFAPNKTYSDTHAIVQAVNRNLEGICNATKTTACGYKACCPTCKKEFDDFFSCVSQKSTAKLRTLFEKHVSDHNATSNIGYKCDLHTCPNVVTGNASNAAESGYRFLLIIMGALFVVIHLIG